MSSRSTGSGSSLWFVVAALALLCLVGGEAQAKKRVVVTPFVGRGAERIHDDVEEMIQGDNTVVSQSAYARARRKIKGRRLDEAGVARIAQDLQVDALIDGSLERRRKKGGGYSLNITVREGLTGAAADKFTVRLKSNKLDHNSSRDLAEKLLPALSAVGELGAEPIEITPTKPGEVDNEQPLAPVEPVAEVPDASIEATGDDRPPGADEYVSYRHARHAAIDVQVGMTAGLRNLRFTFADDLAANQKPNGYKGVIVPSLLVTGELYPLAFGGGRGALSNLGIGFVFDRVLLIKSKLGETEYGTSQTRYGVGLRYRIPFGHKATLPTLKIIAGWNHLDFTIDRGAMDLDLPNVKYSYIDAGLNLRLPLGTPTAALYGDFRYLQILSTGEIMSQEFYGGGSKLGLDGDIGIELIFARRAIIKVGARYQRIALDFDGTGDKSNNRDGDESTQDVGGALDQYFSAYATAGYLF